MHTVQSPGLWTFILKAINVRSVIDVGCGRGISTKWFLDHGADVLCVEGANDAINKSYLPRDKIVSHDFSLGPWWPDKTCASPTTRALSTWCGRWWRRW